MPKVTPSSQEKVRASYQNYMAIKQEGDPSWKTMLIAAGFFFGGVFLFFFSVEDGVEDAFTVCFSGIGISIVLTILATIQSIQYGTRTKNAALELAKSAAIPKEVYRRSIFLGSPEKRILSHIESNYSNLEQKPNSDVLSTSSEMETE